MLQALLGIVYIIRISCTCFYVIYKLDVLYILYALYVWYACIGVCLYVPLLRRSRQSKLFPAGGVYALWCMYALYALYVLYVLCVLYVWRVLYVLHAVAEVD